MTLARYGLLSDVHANLPALRAALAFLDDVGVEGLLCPGDIVGYGPHPNECVEVMAERGAICVAGNHDLMAVGRLEQQQEMIEIVRLTMDWTTAALRSSARAWLEQLPLRVDVPGGVMAHGTLEDPRQYVLSDELAAAQLAALAVDTPSAQWLVLGHTHRALAYGGRSGRVLDHAPGTVGLDAGERWLLNPGAVGQSRDRRLSARVAVLDAADRRITFHAVPYDVEATKADLRRRGLPTAAVQLRPRRVRRQASRISAAVRRRLPRPLR